MRKAGGLLVLALAAITLLAGCGSGPKKLSWADRNLGGQHNLRKVGERMEQNSHLSGGFFLFVGSLSGSSQTEVVVKFAWQMNDRTYAISSLPIEKIRVKLDNNAEIPEISFRVVEYQWDGNRPDLQWQMENNVRYATVTVREKDWPINVDLPLNK